MKRKRLTANQRSDLFEAHNGKCHRCGRPIDPIREKWEVGHIIGLGSGGSDTIENLAPEHKACNRSHGSSVETPLAAKIKRVRNKRLGADQKPQSDLARRWAWKKRIMAERREADVFVQNNDGSFRKVYSTDDDNHRDG